MRFFKNVRLIAATTTVCALMGAGAPAASAGPLVKSAGDCASPTLEQPFTRWLDWSSYVLAPDGTLEHGARAWSLKGASVASGNESYNVHGDDESHSLALPAGSSATTGVMCVGLEHPTLRLFARSTSGLLSPSSLKVDVLFEDSLGSVLTVPIGVVTPSTRWEPTLPLPVLANLLPLLPGDHTPVAFRFTPVGGASWWIDDVYVDPKSRS